MAVSQVFGAQPDVLGATVVTIEADLSRGLHSFSIVGLASKAVEEARDRTNSAIKNSGFKAPKSTNHKIIVSLAPADIKKEGPLFDLPIAIAYLLSAGEIQADVSKKLFLGELALDGTLRPVRGVLPIVRKAKEAGFLEVIVPSENADEAALIEGLAIIPASNLLEVVRHIDIAREDATVILAHPTKKIKGDWEDTLIRLEDIRGQETAKRGLIIAAAGRHNVLMVGPPGTGKTMLARAFQSILPPLSTDDALTVSSIHSYAGTLDDAVSSKPPFRAPHHTASHTSLVGGGAHPKPGEVTLAHKGVLFLDEFPEFERRSIDALRQPLEDRVVSISRVQGSAIFPADFVLVAAMNPYRGSEDGTTDYAAAMMDAYKGKVSGPILDRIDLWLEVPHVPYDTLTEKRDSKTVSDETKKAREQIQKARELALERLKNTPVTTNAEMSARDIEDTIHLSSEVQDLLKVSSAKLNLSPRSYHRLVKVSRTIADLDNSGEIKSEHVLEALQYRVKI